MILITEYNEIILSMTVHLFIFFQFFLDDQLLFIVSIHTFKHQRKTKPSFQFIALKTELSSTEQHLRNMLENTFKKTLEHPKTKSQKKIH